MRHCNHAERTKGCEHCDEVGDIKSGTKVWQVGVSDCESSSTFCICTTKEIALREMFKKRDELISSWKELKIRNNESQKKFLEEQAAKGIHYEPSSDEENTWERMIKNLSHDDYQNWDNYPHEVPWIYETELIDI